MVSGWNVWKVWTRRTGRGSGRLVGAVCLWVLVASCVGGPGRAQPEPVDPGPFDLVIAGGRVLDPERDLDDVLNVGIREGEIVAVTTETLVGAETLDATGLVVAPGFIDLHAHGQDAVSNRYQARDGVTTALELEIGTYPIGPWYAAREGRSLINHGASVGHQAARGRAMGSVFATSNDDGTFTLGAASDATLYAAASADQLERMVALLADGVDQGGLGIGVGLSYTPGSSHDELLRVFELAARRVVPVFIHLRSSGDFRRGGPLAPFQEVVANAASTGASVHVVHMNSSAGRQAERVLSLIRGARARGIDVTTEAYPYTASASLIESPLFDSWEGRADEDYDTLQWVETGERLTRESFDRFRATGGWVIMHGRPEAINEWIVAQPDVIAASDGIPFSQGRAHPRGAGTFARILGVYVRERSALSLMDAVRKMTLLPAQRLEAVSSQMTRKGRVQVGMDADLTLFDAVRVVDRATYDAPDRYSDGIEHVLVGGTFVVRDSTLVEGVAPGRAIRGDGAR